MRCTFLVWITYSIWYSSCYRKVIKWNKMNCLCHSRKKVAVVSKSLHFSRYKAIKFLSRLLSDCSRRNSLKPKPFQSRLTWVVSRTARRVKTTFSKIIKVSHFSCHRSKTEILPISKNLWKAHVWRMTHGFWSACMLYAPADWVIFWRYILHSFYFHLVINEQMTEKGKSSRKIT